MLEIGTILNDNYRVERLLGRGGMASVYIVSNTRLPCLSAVKVVTAQYSSDPEFVRRFRREAEILAALTHPHLVHVTDWNETADGNPYLVMELLQGEDLSQMIRRRGALPIDEALSIFRQVAAALQAAHAQGIVHRDLKPSNIFILSDGAFPNFVKVLDFGVAKLLLEAAPADSTGQSLLIGTPAYMSPEQASGSPHLDARSDHFSLAVVLYEMLTGRRAFYCPGDTPLATLGRVINEEPPPLSLPLAPSSLFRLERILRRALAKDPQARFGSIQEFSDALLNFESGEQEPELGSGLSSMPTQPHADIRPAGGAPSSETLGLAVRELNRPDYQRMRGMFWSMSILVIPAALLLLSGSGYRVPVPAGELPRTEPSQAPRPATATLPHGPPKPLPESSQPSLEPRPPMPMPMPRPASVPESLDKTRRSVRHVAPSRTRWPAISVLADEADQAARQAIAVCIELLLHGLTERERESLVDQALVLDGIPELRIEPHVGLPAPYRNSTNACLAQAGARHPLPSHAVVQIRSQLQRTRP